jgi:hypothetical protein
VLSGCRSAQTLTVTRSVTGPTETVTVTQAGSGTGGSPAPSRCHTTDLAVSLGPGNGAAGSTYYPLEFRNRSGQACTLFGWPGVSAYAGGQVGDAAHRDVGPEKTVLLAPGARASATLQVVDALNFAKATCRPVAVRRLRVFPPDETAAVQVPARLLACRAHGPTFLFIRPIQG